MDTFFLISAILLILVDAVWMVLAPPQSWWRKLKWDIEKLRLRCTINDPSELTLRMPRLWMEDSWRNVLFSRVWHAPLSVKLLVLAGLLLANCITIAVLLVKAFGVNSPVLVVISLAFELFGVFLPFIYLLIGRV